MSDQDSFPIKFVKETAKNIFYGWVIVMIYNSLFAPVRWIFGLRKIDYSIESSFGGYLIAAFCFLPILLFFAGFAYDGPHPERATGGGCPPLVSFVACPIVFTLFILFMRWETRHYYQQIIDYQEAVANQEVEAIQERRQDAVDKLAFFGITRESMAAEEAAYKQQHPEPETDEERLFRWRRQAVAKQRELGLR